MDDLAGYTEQLLYLHVPRPMSDSAELMYCITYTCVNLITHTYYMHARTHAHTHGHM